ncbi:MAG: sigma-54 dependent transcriptional regulator [Desulfotignum sp.]|nr:sigma-54 dependent transcriptional regulator [Desulfotignum sp.]MCF8135702.1 sigma-54 dependent transcriptional regulator [Desulfotignum sp.]
MTEAKRDQFRLLVVDDDTSMREFLELLLSKENYCVTTAENGKRALKLIGSHTYDLVLVDIRLGDITGLEVLKQVKQKHPDTVVIMISAYSTTEIAVTAMNEGAYDFVPKPFDNEELRQTIARALDLQTLEQEKKHRESEIQDYLHFDRIIGNSPGMVGIYNQIHQISATKTNVLITGESGTGKELIARAIHEHSDRKDKPFVVVNCGGIPDTLMESEFFGHVRGAFTGAVVDKKGLFEVAEQGTIFLDEIGELSSLLQVKLLRAVQDTSFTPVGGTTEITVDVRIISATNKELDTEVVEGRFREDLFFRLNVIPIKVPPLRERKGDVSVLAQHFAEKYAKKMGRDIAKLSSYAIDFLNKYSFPGNVRELENLIERSVALSSTNIILPESLTISMHKARRWVEGIENRRFDLNQVEQGVDLDEILSAIESAYLKKALKVTDGDKKKAADLLNLSLRSMRYRLDKIETDS